jgi:hypothetical protein
MFTAYDDTSINPLSPELNPICYLLALSAHDFLHVSRIRVNENTEKRVFYESSAEVGKQKENSPTICFLYKNDRITCRHS